MHRYTLVLSGVVASAALIAGCTSTRPAPVTERSVPPRSASTKPAAAPAPTAPGARAPASPNGNSGLYTVKPGDTLYSIASEHRVDYRDLAIWNGIDNPNALKVGQQLRVVGTPVVREGGSVVAAPGPAPGGAVAEPLKAPGGTIQAKPLGPGPVGTPGAPAAATAAPASQPGSTAAASGPPPASGGVVNEPKGIRLPYSDQAVAQLAAPEAGQAKPEPRVEMKVPPATPSTPQPKSDTAHAESSDWLWPAKGKVVGTFNGTTNKGIDIAGARGQPVLATAPGRVIFSGTGVRGMGKFVVIKHSEDLISVYGHNDEVLVKYGQNVTKGQKIAEMGSTDADQVKLHFEIRRNGTPIDPLSLLPHPA
jgi:lipoprotein NlpD